MPSHQEKKVLPYSPEQLFDLVMDINEYPKFLPWCVGSRITKKEEGVVWADLIIGYKMIREKFTSKVVFEKPNTITVEYQTGPMKYLRNYWRFRPMPGNHTEIDFYVDFEFKSKIFQSLATVFFNEIIHRMVSAFEKRAREVYGDAQLSEDESSDTIIDKA